MDTKLKIIIINYDTNLDDCTNGLIDSESIYQVNMNPYFPLSKRIGNSFFCTSYCVETSCTIGISYLVHPPIFVVIISLLQLSNRFVGFSLHAMVVNIIIMIDVHFLTFSVSAHILQRAVAKLSACYIHSQLGFWRVIGGKASIQPLSPENSSRTIVHCIQ